MKYIVLIFTLTLLSFNVFADVDKRAKILAIHEKIFFVAVKRNLNYFSYHFLKVLIANNSKLIKSEHVDSVLSKIHPSLFIYDNQLDQLSNRDTLLNYPVALRLFFTNKPKEALVRLRTLTEYDQMYLESRFLQGIIYLRLNNTPEAFKSFNSCLNYDKAEIGLIKSKTYIETFKGRCLQQLSRLSFGQENYKQSLEIQNTIKKSNFIWPHMLLDKAWSYYWNGEKPRALGTLITYNSPILQKFISPEAIYLQALIYYDHCQFDKVEKIYQHFSPLNIKQKEIASLSPKRMKQLIISKTDTNTNNSSELLFYSHLKSLKKDIRYINFINSRALLVKEIKSIQRAKSLNRYLEDLKEYLNIVDKDFDHFLEQIRNDYVSQIQITELNFTKMNLTINSDKRKLINSNEKLQKKKGKKIKLSEINNTDDNLIWDFRGGFWADEIGDYAVALENKCTK